MTRLRSPAFGMAIGTAASRATGLARTVALATVLGVGTVSDAYNTANLAPTMLFTLVAGGTVTAAIVPMLARAPAEDRPRVASIVLGTVTAWTVAAAVALALAAPWLMRVMTIGAVGRDDRDQLLRLGIDWMRTFAPQVALYAIGATAVAIMTAHRRLALGAAAPVATNVVVVGAVLLLAAGVGLRPGAGELDGGDVALLGWGTTAAVAAMACIQLIGARATIPSLRFAPRLRDPVVTELRRVGGWMMVYVTANQVGVVAVTAMASSVVGGVSAYQWAFAVMQLPYAVIAVSVLSAAYPGIAGADGAAARSAQVARAGRVVAAALVPAAALLGLLAEPIAASVVGVGERSLVAAAIRGFAVSLVPFTWFQLLTRAAYAAGMARAPAIVNLLANGVLVGGGALAATVPDTGRGVLTGLALAHAGSYVIGCAALHRWLRQARAVDGQVAWWSAIRRPVLASAGLTIVVLLVGADVSGSRAATTLRAGLVGAAAVVVYVAVGYVLGIHRSVDPAEVVSRS